MPEVKANSEFIIRHNVDVHLYPADFTQEDWTFCKEQGILDRVALQCEHGHNLATTVGLNLIAERLIGGSSLTTGNALSHIEVGSGSTAAASGDTGVTTIVGSRHAITTVYGVSPGEAHADTFFLSSENNGTIRETSIHNASSSGNCAAHYIFAGNFTKSISNTMSISWTITFTAVADS